MASTELAPFGVWVGGSEEERREGEKRSRVLSPTKGYFQSWGRRQRGRAESRASVTAAALTRDHRAWGRWAGGAAEQDRTLS